MGCHSLKYMRYNRMAEDLGIDDKTLRQNLILRRRQAGRSDDQLHAPGRRHRLVRRRRPGPDPGDPLAQPGLGVLPT